MAARLKITKKGLLIRLALSICMLGLVLSFAKFDKLTTVLFSIPWYIVLSVIVGYTIGPVLNCFRWLLFARSAGIKSSYAHAIRAYFIGAFVNAFGLGTVGGDVTRAMMLAGNQPVKAAAFASVAADRLHGLAMLALIGSVSAMFANTEHLHPQLLAALSLLAPAIILGWIFGPWFLRKVWTRPGKIHAKLQQALNAFPRKVSVLLFVSFLSLLFHLTQISLHMLMAYGLGVSIPWGVLLVVVPFVNIVSSLPISWMGLGVRENAYIFFLSPLFLSHEQAIAFGALWLLSVTVASGIGGIVSVLSPAQVSANDTVAEEFSS